MHLVTVQLVLVLMAKVLTERPDLQLRVDLDPATELTWERKTNRVEREYQDLLMINMGIVGTGVVT